MNTRNLIASTMLVAGASLAVCASAQEVTRAQVRQELIEAQHNGLNFVTDASYPDVSPSLASQAAWYKQQNGGGMGAAMTGMSESGRGKLQTSPSGSPACVGPASFCNIYSGS
ncbi:DUF4148 domain-containing protein [Burkholderia sp. FERM BP-3421]|jgi:hypothetical protein|uniref:DUF4148 domain-containing protein n=1 Tax=Burkholderia sp. FERM BP-3421 TaxID=1494466 RepID=UPI00235FF0F9|nr:DUF4148 domain-containing protein [Burkholderia sp. FERM BP-3421]WDD91295.1 DUF4148 domain-containing protein [Burkholderia sp. FERM BP-3421]